jgi:hypothetical protein
MLAATAIKEMYAMRLHLSTELRGYLISDFGNLGGVCFSFSSLLWISFWEIQKLYDTENEKLMERCFQFLVFRVIQFFDLLKANKNDKKL